MQEPRIPTRVNSSTTPTSPSTAKGAVYVDPRNTCNPGFHTSTTPTTSQQPFSSSSHHRNNNSSPVSDVNGGVGVGAPPKYRLEAEDDAGDCEYKWRLVGITSSRFEHLVTQMNFRVSEGQGKCLYEIGVHDDGTAKGLDDADFEESVGVVKRMAGVLSLDVEIVAVQDVTPTIAELLHEQRQYLASRRTALEGLLSRNIKMMYPTGVGAAAPSSSSPIPNTNNIYHHHQPFHFQKQYERRHEELSEALQSIVVQQAAADKEDVAIKPPTTTLKSNSSLQQVLAAPLVQPKRMRCAEILVTRRPAQVCDVRVVMCGEEGAGKSTLVGVLTRGALDDGNGAVRSSIFSHRHELFSGKTSTIASHAIGFNAEGFITNYEEESSTLVGDSGITNTNTSHTNPTSVQTDARAVVEGDASHRPIITPPTHPVVVSTEEARTKFRLSHNNNTLTAPTTPLPTPASTITVGSPTPTQQQSTTATSLLSRTAMSLAEKSVKLVTLLDIGGSGQYSRTAFFGLTARNPGYVSLVIDASKMINDEGGMGAFQASSSTFAHPGEEEVPADGDEAGGESFGGLLSEESDGVTAPPATTTPSPAMTPMMRRLDSCIGQYIAVCCVAKIPFFLILTKVDDVCELEMDDFLYEVDNYISTITSRFDRQHGGGVGGSGNTHLEEDYEGGDENVESIKTLVVSVPEHLSHRDLVAGGSSSDPSHKSATETVLRAVIGCVTRSCVPVFLASSVSGAGLGALRAFFHQLPVQYGHQVVVAPPQPETAPSTNPTDGNTRYDHHNNTSTASTPPPPTEVLIEGAFFVPARNVGVVLAGVILRGSVRVGQHLRLGPDRFGAFYDATVLSIHTQPDGSYVSRLGEGSDGTFAIGHYGCDFCVSNNSGLVKSDISSDTAASTITTPNIFEVLCGGGAAAENNIATTTFAITSPTTTNNNNVIINYQPTTVANTLSSPPRSRRGSSPTTTREPSTETSHGSSGTSCCNAANVDQPLSISTGINPTSHHLLHPHLIRPLPSDQIPPLTTCYQHHNQTSPVLNNNASTKRKEALSAAHLIQTFPVSSFFFGRKGTVLVSPPLSTTITPTSSSLPPPPGLCFRFECRMHMLPSPHRRRRPRLLSREDGGEGGTCTSSTTPHVTTNNNIENGIAVGQEPVVHCRNIRQAARIDGVFASLPTQHRGAPTLNRNMCRVRNVVCQFLYFPEVLSLGATVLLRCGQAISAVGTVVFIHPLQKGIIAPKSPTLRAARYPPPTPHNHLHQLPPLPPPTASLSDSTIKPSAVAFNTNVEDEDPLLREMMILEEMEGGGGNGNLSLFADDDEDKRNRKQPQQQRRQRVPATTDDLSTSAAGAIHEGGVVDPERRRLEHECRRLSRAERRARHYALILSHKSRKEQQQDEAVNIGEGNRKRRSDELEGGGSSSTTMGGRYCSNYSYYSSTATATPPPTPDTAGGGSGGGTWANYQHPSWNNNNGTRRGGPTPFTTTSTPSTATTIRGGDGSGTMMTPTMTASPPMSPDIEGGKDAFTMSGNQPTAEFLCPSDNDVDMM